MTKLIWKALAGMVLAGCLLEAQDFGPRERPWRNLASTIALHGAASGFDAWTSWQRMERNPVLADRGRFTTSSAARKAGWFAGVSLVQVLVVKKWGKKHPWVERACMIGNVGTSGMLFSAGMYNLANRR
mgnify:CR=1 FL=1